METPISLNQKASCGDLKEKSSKMVSDAKTALFNAASKAISGFFSALLAPITALINLFSEKWGESERLYYEAKEAPQKLSGKAKEEWAKAKKALNQLTTPTACSIDNTSVSNTSTSASTSFISEPTTVTSNVVSETFSSPSSNDEFIQGISEQFKQKKTLEDSKSKSIQEQVAAAQDLMNSASTASIPYLREMARQLRGKNPNIDSALDANEVGKPASEYIGSSIIGYSLDKSTLPLSYWGTGTPSALRKNLMAKVSSNQKSVIQSAYDKTNSGLYNNLPREFKDEQSVMGMYLPHGYHIAGDYEFYKNHINNSTFVGLTIQAMCAGSIGNVAKLVNYINPIVEDITVTNAPVLVMEEDYEVAVDNRKNIYRLPLTSNQKLSEPTKVA